jgi:hypothetical protein
MFMTKFKKGGKLVIVLGEVVAILPHGETDVQLLLEGGGSVVVDGETDKDVIAKDPDASVNGAFKTVHPRSESSK